MPPLTGQDPREKASGRRLTDKMKQARGYYGALQPVQFGRKALRLATWCYMQWTRYAQNRHPFLLYALDIIVRLPFW